MIVYVYYLIRYYNMADGHLKDLAKKNIGLLTLTGQHGRISPACEVTRPHRLEA